jgi:hypothetical protein
MGLMTFLRSLIVAAGLVGLAGTAYADLDSQCPDYPGQTHAQILRGVEGRLKGDWDFAIKTTKRSAKRLKDSGQDASQAELFVTVLTCLRDEVKAGKHADAVAEARENPKPEAGTPAPPSKADFNNGSTQGAVTPAPAPLPSPAPAPAPAPALAEAAAPAPAPQPAPAPASGPIIVSSQGVLPGTAESYGQAPAPAPAPAPAATQEAAAPPAPANGDYSGQACAYFTRPYEEVIDGLRHINRYNEGEWVCHGGTMYACIGGAWESKGPCDKYNRWETRLSSTLEATPK